MMQAQCVMRRRMADCKKKEQEQMVDCMKS